MRVQRSHEKDEDTMTNATMNRDFNPGRPPLAGIFAVVAAAVTMSLAVLLPAQLEPTHARVRTPAASAAPMVAAEAPAQIVTLPSVNVTAARPAKAAANNHWNVPAVHRQAS
jgi:hypothetical protein